MVDAAKPPTFLSLLETLELNLDIFRKYIPDEKRTLSAARNDRIIQAHGLGGFWKFRTTDHALTAMRDPDIEILGLSHFWKRRRTMIPGSLLNSIPDGLLEINDIYEMNFVPVQFLLNVIDKKISHEHLTVLVWGCGMPVVDCYLDNLGYNVISYDNWSQISKECASEYLEDTNNNITLIDNRAELYGHDYDVIIDTGSYMDDEKAVQNPRVKIVFTWLTERLGSNNLDYLNSRFFRIDFPTSVVFIRNDLARKC